MKRFLLIATACVFHVSIAYTQGCVAIRSTGTVCTRPDATQDVVQGWQVNTVYRYFKSFRHFVGREEQKERIERNTEVINWQHSLDIAIIRHLNRRWSIALNVPIISNKRSSLYEHGGNNAGKGARHNTHSFGLGDMRFTVYHWLLDPVASPKFNVQAGLGIKFPTGAYNVQDFFIKNDTTQVQGPVDQSIQLGDGGTGFTLELNTYYNITDVISVYGSFYYLLNPREQNGTSNKRGGTPTATDFTYQTATHSVPDQYMWRAGGNFNFDRLTASAGMRMECVPSKDLVGGNGGFRRPGYVISAEPGLAYQFKKVHAFATVPVALVRNRTQSNADKIRTRVTGVYAQGDAAFADYSVNVGLSFRL